MLDMTSVAIVAPLRLPQSRLEITRKIAGVLLLLAEGLPQGSPATWLAIAEVLGIICVPVPKDSGVGKGYYMPASTVESSGWDIPKGKALIWWDTSLEEAYQCRVLVHELAHHLVLALSADVAQEEHHAVALWVESLLVGPRTP